MATVRAGQLHVATAQGLQLAQAGEGIGVGDAVTLTDGRVTRAEGKVAEVYF